MFIQSYISTAKEILKRYEGWEPFASFLKKFFKENKKFGSRDRKQIAHLCYCFFRLGKSLENCSVEERLSVAIYLCDHTSSRLLEALNAEWNKTLSFEIAEKIETIKRQHEFDLAAIFPFNKHLSNAIEFDSFVKSFLIQPDIYLRLRPGKETIVQQKLSAAQISFQLKNRMTVALPPATKLDEVLLLNKEAVIQDLSSQNVLEPLLKEVAGKRELKTAWDSCAASGGKSILLFDQFPGIQLTVSDIRESILINLKKRFFEAGIHSYKKLIADISNSPLSLENKFELIICDAPCSGSGTWSRTPEQLYFFDEKKIQHYSSLQKKIVTNAVKNLHGGGYLLYITCSVFREENEEVAAFIEQNLSIQLLQQQYFTGYTEKADTLFVALFIA